MFLSSISFFSFSILHAFITHFSLKYLLELQDEKRICKNKVILYSLKMHNLSGCLVNVWKINVALNGKCRVVLEKKKSDFMSSIFLFVRIWINNLFMHVVSSHWANRTNSAATFSAPGIWIQLKSLRLIRAIMKAQIQSSHHFVKWGVFIWISAALELFIFYVFAPKTLKNKTQTREQIFTGAVSVSAKASHFFGSKFKY